MKKFIVTQIAGRVVLPIYFIGMALLSVFRPYVGARAAKAISEARNSG